MKIYLTILLSAVLYLTSCQPDQSGLTADEKKKEEAEIIRVIESNNTASENKNFAELLKTLADSVAFFGTDQNEIIKTFAEYKEAIQKQWAAYEYTNFSNIYDVFITMDNNASVASIIYGVDLEAKSHGVTEKLFLRVSRNLLKQNGNWVIASGITSIPRNSAVVIDTSMPAEVITP
jgi:ketosteroid isomerase-like protein